MFRPLDGHPAGDPAPSLLAGLALVPGARGLEPTGGRSTAPARLPSSILQSNSVLIAPVAV
ncbi:hypothetical protein V3331_10880 [Gaopeijia maritima]|uniref:hypothetical protein n=1 Tax=Gaopeijia maritima TaxID=3119007 RepID=UPI00325626E5